MMADLASPAHKLDRLAGTLALPDATYPRETEWETHF
jgi:hypothetical protein